MALVKSQTKDLKEAAPVVKTTAPATPIPAVQNSTHEDNATMHGAALPPPSANGFEVVSGEFLQASNPSVANNVIDLAVKSYFYCRYLYSLLVVNPSVAGNYYLLCDVTLWRNFSPLGNFPLCDAIGPASASVLPRTLLSAFVGGGNVLDSSMIVSLQSPQGVETPQYILQPQYFEMECDRVTVSVKEFRNVTGFRLFAAMKSVSKFKAY